MAEQEDKIFVIALRRFCKSDQGTPTETQEVIVETIERICRVHGYLGFMDISRTDNKLVPVVGRFVNSPELNEIARVLLNKNPKCAWFDLFPIIVLIVNSQGVSVVATNRQEELKQNRLRTASLMKEAAKLIRANSPPESEFEEEDFDFYSEMAVKLSSKVENNYSFEEVANEFLARRTELFIESENIGKSGRATSDPSGTHGALVKQMNKLIPEEISQRYSMISKLFAIRDISISRQDVRGILLRGRT